MNLRWTKNGRNEILLVVRNAPPNTPYIAFRPKLMTFDVMMRRQYGGATFPTMVKRTKDLMEAVGVLFRVAAQ